MQLTILAGVLAALMSLIDAEAHFQNNRHIFNTICSVANRPSTELIELKTVILTDLMHYRLLKDPSCPGVSVTYAFADQAEGRSVRDFKSELRVAGRLPGLKVYCATVIGKFSDSYDKVFLVYNVVQFKSVKLNKNHRFNLSEISCDK